MCGELLILGKSVIRHTHRYSPATNRQFFHGLSMLAFIERRFLANGNGNAKGNAFAGHASLTLRDLNADPLLDIFDFVHSPSLNASVPTAPLPVAGENGCPILP